MPSKSTIARTLILALALVNQLLSAVGRSPIQLDDATISDAVSVCFTIVAAVIAWWKNNSFTQPALKADAFMKELKSK